MRATVTRVLLLIVVILSTAESVQSQNVQWASEVVGYSSQFTEKFVSPRFRATQVLGKPNVMPQGGGSPCAWAPKNKSGKQWIHVRYKESMQIKQVAIAESQNCGTVVAISLIDDQGKKHKIKSYTKPAEGEISRMYRINMRLTEYKVKEVIVYTKGHLVNGWNEIDAIGISDSETPIKAEINTVPAEEDIQLEILSSNVNSKWSDLKPTISPDGKSLFIVRKEHPDNIGNEGKDDIWISEMGPNGWLPIIHLGSPLNNKDHNYVNGVSTDGNVVLLGNKYGSNGNAGKGMSLSHLREGDWQKPTALNIKNYYNKSIYMESHVACNFKAIVMAVTRNNTYGDKDIYVSFHQGGNNWSEPRNLGPVINTACTEMAPFLAADGKTLYYATSGISGYGSHDTFMSHRLDETWQNWSEPINMGPVINSDGWDAYLSLDAEGEYAFLSRTTKGSKTMGDVYKIHLAAETRPEKMQIAEIKLSGMQGNEEALLSYANIDDPTISGIAYSKQVKGGHVIHFAAHLSGTYILLIDVPGYKPIEHTLNVAKSPDAKFTLEKKDD